MGQLDTKVAIITGAAGGIGRACARMYAQHGASVILADVHDQRGQQLADELGATYVHCNVADESQIDALVQTAITAHGQLDIMMNNAGLGGVVGPIAQLPVEEFDLTVGVLFRGVFLGTKHAARVMQPRKRGVIINTTSVAGQLAGLAPHVYGACKAAVLQLTRSVATELGESGVRVNSICPGAVATPLVSEFLTGNYTTPTAVRDAMAQHQPLPRAGVPDDIARAALWLASDDASFVNGHNLVVDGGLSCGVRWSDAPGEWMRTHTPMRTPMGEE